MEMYNFIRGCELQCFTVGDVRAMEEGDCFDVVIWDKNFEDYSIYSGTEPEVHYSPEDFFSSNRHTIIYNGDTTLNIDHIEQSIEINSGNGWEQVDASGNLHNKDGECVGHMSGVQDYVLAGYKGPIMNWSELASMRNVYRNKDDSSEEGSDNDFPKPK